MNALEKIAQTLGKNFLDLLPENILFNNNEQKGGIALAYQSTIHQQSEKLIEQFEKQLFEKDIRITEKEERIEELKDIIIELKKN